MKTLFPVHYLLLTVCVFFILLASCLFFLPNTMIPLLTGLILAYAFDPLIDKFVKKGISRKKAVFWFFIFVGFVFLLLITILIPYLFSQISDFIENFPSLLIRALNWISDKLKIETSAFKTKLFALLKEQYNAENFSKLAKIIKLSFSSTANWIISFFGTLLVPVFFYFFIIDIDKIKLNIFRYIPVKYQTFIKNRLIKIDSILSGFIRGQLMVAFILSILYSIGLIAAGVKYGLLIGLSAGLLNFIPYLGVGLGISASVVMCLLDGSSFFVILYVLIIFAVVQIMEGFVITPRIVGNKVGLSPLSAILAILIGGELFGIAGMLAAIPTGGVMRVIYRDVKAAYLKSNFYKKG